MEMLSAGAARVHTRVPVLAMLLIVAGLAVAGPAGRRRLSAQAPAVMGAIGCDARNQQLAFPLAEPDSGGTPGELLQGGLPDTALDAGEPRLAVTCQAVFADSVAAQAGDAFALAPGNVTFGVIGPGFIVESGSQSYTVPCGDPAAAGSCRGATALEVQGSATPAAAATNALTFHVALLPGSALPLLPVTAAITVQALYSAADGSGTAPASTAIDLAPPQYRLALSSDRAVIGNEATERVALTARLSRAVPNLCQPLQQGSYLVCQAISANPGTEGVEPGTVTFSSDVGSFVNLQRSIQAVCGQTVSTALIVPPLGSDHPYPTDCKEAGARLAPFGQGGDATITATFTGAVTGATARDRIRVTVAPQPVSLTLTGGCTSLQVPSTLPPGAPVTLLVESVNPSTAVYAVWRQDPQTGRWQPGYLRDAAAPLGFATINPGDQVFVCVDTVAKFPLG